MPYFDEMQADDEARFYRENVDVFCELACPVGTQPWRYIAYLQHGELEKAYLAIREPNPFPSVCARVCNHPCEANCRLGKISKTPVAIRALKRFVVDNVSPDIFQPEIAETSSEEKIAIVGAGPAGITAAHLLSLKGYKITLFEAEKVLGGMLVAGIPEYRLPKTLVKREIDALLNANISVNLNSKLGEDFTIAGLFEQNFKAVLIAIGSHKSRKLAIPGEDAQNVFPSMQFLKAQNLENRQLAKGKVAVIGGGNSAIDAARVALRQKDVQSVTIFYRRSRAEMPAFEEEIEDALSEGVKLETLVSPIKILTGDSADGKPLLNAVEFAKNKLGEPDKSGRRRPIPIKNSNFTREIDTLIVAIGELPDTDKIAKRQNSKDKFSPQVNKNNTLIANPDTFQTVNEAVFACGDAVSGSKTVIDAIAAGKKAALLIGKFLQGEELQVDKKRRYPDVYIPPVPVSAKNYSAFERLKMPKINANVKNNFAEIYTAISPDDAKREAMRCLRCDLEFTQKIKAKQDSAILLYLFLLFIIVLLIILQ